MSEHLGAWLPPTSGPVPPPPGSGFPPPPGSTFPPPPVAPAAASGGRSALGRRISLIVGALFLLSGALHIAGLFPALGTHYPAASNTTSGVVEQAIIAAGWLAAALAVLLRRPFSVAACLGAAGIALAELGLAVASFAQVAALTTAGVGAWLFLVAWIPGLVGAVFGLLVARRTLSPADRPGSPRRALGVRGSRVALATLIVAIGLGFALLPGWDHYVLTSSTLNRTVLTRTLGAAFATSTPTGVLVGDLLSALAFLLLPLVAVAWRPARTGVALSGGVLVVVASQIASAIVGFHQSPAYFGFSSGTISRFGLVLHSSLTGWFVVELLAGVVLLVLVVAQWRQPPDDGLAAGLGFSTSAARSGSAVAHDGGGWPYQSGYRWPDNYPLSDSSIPTAPSGPNQ